MPETLLLDWNETTQRYEAPHEERTFCVDQEAFRRAMDEATADPRNDAYKVYNHFSRVGVWESQVGTNPQVYYADQANCYQHRIAFHSRNGWELLRREIQDDPRWQRMTVQHFRWEEEQKTTRKGEPTGLYNLWFVLTLLSKEPFPRDLWSEICQKSSLWENRTILDLPRHQ